MAVSLSTAVASTLWAGRVFAAGMRPGWIVCPSHAVLLSSKVALAWFPVHHYHDGTLESRWWHQTNIMLLLPRTPVPLPKKGWEVLYDARTFRWSASGITNATLRRLNFWSCLSRDKVLRPAFATIAGCNFGSSCSYQRQTPRAIWSYVEVKVAQRSSATNVSTLSNPSESVSLSLMNGLFCNSHHRRLLRD